MKPLEAIRCTIPTCRCECFAPGKQSLRFCGTCNHGWVAHALDKLGTNHVMNLGIQVEVVQPNIVFDIASLMLYGTHATPVRLKILLDRLFSVLQHEEVLQILHGFGWTYEDYARGYILQDNSGRVLDKWCVATLEEELVVLHQFLRFGETKAIAQEIILQDTKDRHEVLVKHKVTAESDIKKFIERSNLSMQNYIKSYESTRQLFGSTHVPCIPPTNRVVSSSIIPPNYSPSREPRVPMPHISSTLSTPLSTPPLNCLQVVQHFDTHKEQPSPILNLSLGSSDACRSPMCDSPQNLSTASTVISVTSPSHQSLQPQHHGLDEIDGSDPYITGSEDEGEAIDYSNKDISDSPADGDARGKQHVRKSTNPIKRQWTPSVNFGNTYVGPNGKKRVLCAACNKTFCDKGALKIHYSAVHLKEMHKCTVEGCSMLFSSRRSRNRHSANSNPKLHMPQKRKDELDQTDETSMSIMSEPNTSTTPTKSIPTSSPVQPVHPQFPVILDPQHMIRPESNFFIDMSSKYPFLAPPEKRLKLEAEQPTDLSKLTLCKSPSEEPCDLSQKLDDEVKLEIDLDKCTVTKEDVDQSGRETDVLKTNNEWAIKGGKRRKSSAPIRCAQTGVSQPTSYDNAGNKMSKSRSPLTIHNGEILDFNGATSWDVRNNVHMSLQTDVERSQMDDNYDCIDQEEQMQELIDGQPYSQSSNEKRNDRHEARNFPKMASLLWSGTTIINSASVSADRVSLQQTDKGYTKYKESTKKEITTVAGDVSDCESSEDTSLPPNDVTRHYPPDIYLDKEHPLKCKICGKIFQNSFTVKIHFHAVHLKAMNPYTADNWSATFPSNQRFDHHRISMQLHQRIHADDVIADTETSHTCNDDIVARLYSQDLTSANMVSSTAAKVRNSDIEHSNAKNMELKRGQSEDLFYAVNNEKVTDDLDSNPPKITIQLGLNGHNIKPDQKISETLEEREGEGNHMNKNKCLYDGVQSETYDVKLSSSLVQQDHTSFSQTEHASDRPDPAVRTAVSPRRACSRQKTLNGMSSRALTSL